jgi:hypothetical protein
MRHKRENGVALITTILVLLLMSALLVGFTMMVMTDQQLGSLERDRTVALYAAHAGLEKLTADLGTLFSANAAPTGAMVNNLTSPGNLPSLPGIVYAEPGNSPGTGYQITFPVDAAGNPLAQTRTILSGPYQGFVGLITPYTMTVTARSLNGSEVRLRRVVQTVGIPVFQFGIFSETDLSFFAGPNFNFGGRTHTNGNLFLAQGNGTTLTMGDRVTAVNEVIRTNLSNGWPVTSNYNGTVNIITSPGVFRPLGQNEGSLVGTLGTAPNEPLWTNLSLSTYNGNLRNGRTGARTLNLPLALLGAQPIDLIRRPPPAEDVNNPGVFAQRFFTNNPGDQITSMRILLSDTPADILNLPTVSSTPPINLNNQAQFQAGGVLGPGSALPGGGVQAPLAMSEASGVNGSLTPTANTPLVGGYIKVEIFNATTGAWQDVTAEILNLGFTGKNLATGSNQWNTPGSCAEPNPNAVIRLQRIRDAGGTTCNISTTPQHYWPNALYDQREGGLRDSADNLIKLGGIMHYVELDVRNLGRWLTGAIGTNGTRAVNVNGWVVYFSDRRGNRNTAGQETGEFGCEDFVNPTSSTGTPNGILDAGEDVNSNGVLDTYGCTPRFPAVPFGSGPPAPNSASTPQFNSPLNATATLRTTIAAASTTSASTARANPPIFFRRALKLVNGGLGNIPLPGLTIASENPVYIQGDWNASSTGAGFGNPHAATSVIADSITFLSNGWNDINSFRAPTNVNSGTPRQATATWYRLAVISGKGRSFPQPSGTAQDFGTDGGVHNFLRFLERWGSSLQLNYRGSIISFYYNRQGVGTYKCCSTVYSPPNRGYNFDTDFLTPTLLPPRTPMFRDVNTIGFSQIVNPNQP